MSACRRKIYGATDRNGGVLITAGDMHGTVMVVALFIVDPISYGGMPTGRMSAAA